MLGMSSKSFSATPNHFKKPKFLFRKKRRRKFLDVKLVRFAVRLAGPMENYRSTAAESGKGVLYFINRPTSTLHCLHFES